MKTGKITNCIWTQTRIGPRLDSKKRDRLWVGATIQSDTEINNWWSTQRGWVHNSYIRWEDEIVIVPPVIGLEIARTLHAWDSYHNGMNWPARTNLNEIPAATNSFDVCSRLYIDPNPHHPGLQIYLTKQQWQATLWKNRHCPNFEKWAVGGTDRLMSWQDNRPYPVFHYPILLGGNFVYKVTSNSKMTLIETIPSGMDISDEMLDNPTKWMRCWSKYAGRPFIRDAPAGVGHTAAECYIPLLAQNSFMYVYDASLEYEK